MDFVKELTILIFSVITFFVGVMSGGALLAHTAPDHGWLIILGWTLFPFALTAIGTILQGASVILLPILILKWLWPSKKKDEVEEDESSPEGSAFESFLTGGVMAVMVVTFTAIFGAANMLAGWFGAQPLLWSGLVGAGVGAAWGTTLVILARSGCYVLFE